MKIKETAGILWGLAVVVIVYGCMYAVVEAEVCSVISIQNLSVGSVGEEVLQLQVFLNNDPRTQLATFGPGSPGQESVYFGSITKAAVIRFQNIYAAEVLYPIGLTQGTGYVGPKTRSLLDAMCLDMRSKVVFEKPEMKTVNVEVLNEESEEEEDVEIIEVLSEKVVDTKNQTTGMVSSVQSITNGDGDSVKTKFEITFTLGSVGNTMYIPFGASLSDANKGVLFDVEDPNTNNTISGLSSSNLSSVIMSSNADRENGYFRLNVGDSAEFTLTLDLKSNGGAVTGAHRIQLEKIRYTNSVGGSLQNFKLLPEEKFESGIGVLDA